MYIANLWNVWEAGAMEPGIVDGQRDQGQHAELNRFASGVDATFIMQPDGTLAGTYTLFRNIL